MAVTIAAGIHNSKWKSDVMASKPSGQIIRHNIRLGFIALLDVIFRAIVERCDWSCPIIRSCHVIIAGSICTENHFLGRTNTL